MSYKTYAQLRICLKLCQIKMPLTEKFFWYASILSSLLFLELHQGSYARTTDPISIATDKRRWQLVRTPSTWREAASYCRQLPGSLTTVTGRHLHRKLAAIMELYGLDKAWIGAEDMLPDSNMYWTSFDGKLEPLSEEQQLDSEGTKPFHENRCAAVDIMKSSKIHLKACTEKYNYLCEKATQSSCRHSLVTGSHCLDVIAAGSTWYEARAACQKQGGRLAMVTDFRDLSKMVANHNMDRRGESAAEEDSLSKPQQGKYWVGLSSTKWRWSNGDIVKETFWEKEEPSQGGACAVMEQFTVDDVTTYLWASDNCGTSHPFICEVGTDNSSRPPDPESHKEPDPEPETDKIISFNLTWDGIKDNVGYVLLSFGAGVFITLVPLVAVCGCLVRAKAESRRYLERALYNGVTTARHGLGCPHFTTANTHYQTPDIGSAPYDPIYASPSSHTYCECQDPGAIYADPALERRGGRRHELQPPHYGAVDNPAYAREISTSCHSVVSDCPDFPPPVPPASHRTHRRD